MNVDRLARPEIVALKPYVTARQMPHTLRLNANESSRAPGKASDGDGLNRYPEIRPRAVRARLASLFAIAEARLLPTRGSSEAIDTLLRAFCRPYADDIVVASPSFSMYRVYADIQGAGVVTVGLNAAEDFALDPAAIAAACTPATKLVFLCSPNNPTGRSIPCDDVVSLARARSGRSLIVVDEAYVEFSARRSVATLSESFDNVVVLRTLSKAYGLAGTRCGAVLADPVVIDLLERVLPPYSFSSPATQCVLEFLTEDAVAERRRVVEETIAERARLESALARSPRVERVWPSDGNFLLARFSDLSRVREQLAAARILIREFAGDPALANCARITVGSPAENDRLLAALAETTETRRCP